MHHHDIGFILQIKCSGILICHNQIKAKTVISMQVMLLGHSDSYVQDVIMQVTIAFNYFGEGLVQRMPR